MVRVNELDSNSVGFYVAQGHLAVSDDPDAVYTTMLGSCVCTCLFDPVARLGGMNHLLLPDARPRDESDPFALRQQVNDMERLINALLRKGANRTRLQAKVFGGASVISARAEIGNQNRDFVFNFLKREEIDCLAYSVGGTRPRRLRFWPASGRVLVRYVKDVPLEVLVESESSNASQSHASTEIF